MNDHFYLDQPEPNKSCLLAMRDLLLKFHNSISETTKYGMPCFTLHDKMFCFLWTDKKTTEPYFLFVDGHKMEHASLETGSRSRMKILRVDPYNDLPIAAIEEIMHLGLQLRS